MKSYCHTCITWTVTNNIQTHDGVVVCTYGNFTFNKQPLYQYNCATTAAGAAAEAEKQEGKTTTMTSFSA